MNNLAEVKQILMGWLFHMDPLMSHRLTVQITQKHFPEIFFQSVLISSESLVYAL